VADNGSIEEEITAVDWVTGKELVVCCWRLENSEVEGI